MSGKVISIHDAKIKTVLIHQWEGNQYSRCQDQDRFGRH
jgi:hypothetical protein